MRMYVTAILLSESSFNQRHLQDLAKFVRAEGRDLDPETQAQFISNRLPECMTQHFIATFHEIGERHWKSQMKQLARLAESNRANARRILEQQTASHRTPGKTNAPELGEAFAQLLAHWSITSSRANKYSNEKVTVKIRQDLEHFVGIATETFREMAPLWDLEEKWKSSVEPTKPSSRQSPLQGYQRVVLSAQKGGRTIDEILRIYHRFLKKGSIRRKTITRKTMSVYVSRWKAKAKTLGVYEEIDERMHIQYLRR